MKVDDEERARYLAELLDRQRLKKHLSKRDIAAKAGVARPLVDKLLAGRPGTYQAAKLAAVSSAVGWSPDGIERVLSSSQPAEAAAASELEQRVATLEGQYDDVVIRLRRLEEEGGDEQSEDVHQRARQTAAKGRQHVAGELSASKNPIPRRRGGSA